MPPRKSNISQISAAGDEGTPVKEREGINIEDLSLPRTMVQRLAKGVLPPNTSLHKDAILAMSKGATVFINYLAHAANTASLSTGKRTIPPNAVIEALAELEFQDFGPRVEAELKKFNEVQTGKRNEYRRKVKEGKMSGAKGEDGGEEGEDEEGRAKKRVRREEGHEGHEGRERRESGTGDPSAQLQTGYREYEPEDPEDPDDDDDDDFDAEGQTGEEGGNDASNLEPRPRASRDEEEEEEEEDEDEDEDEDEYPDEGRRLSSVEREANGSFDTPGDDAVTPGSSADEVLSEDEGSD
ncbi:hypothetical protein HO133_002692 [Letharia lupina]|uniref:DNA polymerase epsilon subunit D n=1 Tax=Letharia lupina TaxID=560253 RepID=A0A8H6CCY7_9LECA|nr:uncharacterized protein HO133_002692 [Letharia lupina]KAF6221011.1 hypothetical protein HO133_002692 [Letharia lupina]